MAVAGITKLKKSWIGLVVLCAIVAVLMRSGAISQANSYQALFQGSIVLGRPDNHSITASIVADQRSQVYLKWGGTSDSYSFSSSVYSTSATEPAVILMDGLEPGQEYYYRLFYNYDDSGEFLCTQEYSFRTPRLSDQAYSFVIQSDSHLFNKADEELYKQTMQEMAACNPDFLFDLGDTFLNDKTTDPARLKYENISKVVSAQRPYLDIVTRNAPLFLTIGNHEGESGFYLDGTDQNLNVMATQARMKYFPNPIPNGFYTGNDNNEEFVGQPENYYAFEWGDALYVSIDPYRYCEADPYGDKDGWNWTLGKEQYDWLRKTLENSDAKYKFVFAHHALGNTRGGAEIASLFEWGGYDRKGRYLFDEKRPGWGKPIQQVMKDTGVTIFFQGHDHLFAREVVDGVIYQTLPKSAEKYADRQNNFSSYPSADKLLNSGFLKVSVTPAAVQVDYNRSYYVSTDPQEGNTGIVYSYTVSSDHEISVLKASADDFSTYSASDHSGKNQDDQKIRSKIVRQKTIDGRDQGEDGETIMDRVSKGQSGSQDPGSIILGCPTDSGISAKVLSRWDGTVLIEYGTKAGIIDGRSKEFACARGDVLNIDLGGLEPDTGYFYRLLVKSAGGLEYDIAQSGAFHTCRNPGDSFTFTIQADSHRDENTDIQLYKNTLTNVLKDKPDFLIDLGDTFMSEKITSNEDETIQRYIDDRGCFAAIGANVPLFLVNGNHEGENGWIRSHGEDNVAFWASAARLEYFPNPVSGEFYSGSEPGEGNYYAFTWGDALFVVLDPFWFSEEKARGSEDGWNYTLGKDQYDWLKSTLQNSGARYKFVFIHNLVGGYGKDARGGAEASAYFEWGGLNSDGSYGFDKMRPGWGEPIHELLVDSGVNVVFHGHDHFYARQERDGIVYQLVPQPGHNGKDIKNATEYSYLEGNFLPPAGHMRVQVNNGGLKVEYIKSSLNTAQNYTIADSYSIK